MTATSFRRIIVPCLVLVAAGGAALVFGSTQIWREPPRETNAAIAAPAVSQPAPGARNEGSPKLATAAAEADPVGALGGSRSPVADEPGPAFDVARVEPTGEAVIAGSAAPGATVELLRNGERHDQAVADASGQFVMVPPRLPAGDYQLTLRSRLPDGTLATSKQGVAVALAEVKSSSAATQSRAELPFSVPKTAVASPLLQDNTGKSSQAPQLAAATPLSDEGPSSSPVEPNSATAVVSRGDSLWSISRSTYGAGMRYADVYKANRDQIRHPDRIYPGQIFVLPKAP